MVAGDSKEIFKMTQETVPSTVQMKWVDATLMVGVDSGGRPVVTGGFPNEVADWRGLKASDLLLLSVASCSAYDVVTILRKQREPLEKLDITCTGEQLKEPPYRFVRIHIHYSARGAVSAENLAKAIQLSEDKYCSVINSLRPQVEITSDFEIVP